MRRVGSAEDSRRPDRATTPHQSAGSGLNSPLGRGKEFAPASSPSMLRDTAPEIFTADEVARAAGVSKRIVEAQLAAARIPRIDGTRYISAADALRLTRALRRRDDVPAAAAMFSLPIRDAVATRGRRTPRLVSMCAHAALLAGILWLTSGSTESASTSEPVEQTRMVFLVLPGPGGGGGGGRLRDPQPAPK